MSSETDKQYARSKNNAEAEFKDFDSTNPVAFASDLSSALDSVSDLIDKDSNTYEV